MRPNSQSSVYCLNHEQEQEFKLNKLNQTALLQKKWKLRLPLAPKSLFSHYSVLRESEKVLKLLSQFSCSVMSNSLLPRGLQHTRPPCPSPFPKVCSSSCPLHLWHHPAFSSSDALFFFCPQSFPASGTFPVSHLFASGDQNTGASASPSVLPTGIQGWFPLRLTGLILLSKGLSGVICSTIVWRHQFFGALPSLWSSSHNYMWPLGRP